MIDYFKTFSDKLITAFIGHIELTSFSLLFALLFASVITVTLLFYPKIRQTFVYVLSLLHAVSSFALFTLLILVTGLGTRTVIIASVIYAQYALARIFLAGLTQVDDSIVKAAIGMGMTGWQVLAKIQLPLARFSIFAGLRLAASSMIAIVTITSTINAGGLGNILSDGLRTMSLPELFWGIILTVALSSLVNLILYLVEELVKNENVG